MFHIHIKVQALKILILVSFCIDVASHTFLSYAIDEVLHKQLSLEMSLTVITDMNEACIPRSSTVLLLLIISVCRNGAVQNMASLVLVEGKLVYFMQ